MATPVDTPLGARLLAYRHHVHEDKVLLAVGMADPKDRRYSEVLLSEDNVDDLVFALLEAKRAVARLRKAQGG